MRDVQLSSYSFKDYTMQKYFLLLKRWVATALLSFLAITFVWQGAFIADNTAIADTADKIENKVGRGLDSSKDFVDDVKQSVKQSADKSESRVDRATDADDGIIENKADKDADRINQRANEDAARTKKAIDKTGNVFEDAIDSVKGVFDN